ncbi:hypothetical protein XENTR_v10005445 [Xenopus tropicalis]|nr:hypothetical protein XENTR_v10005445 [Xenopus tropicalis]
MMNWIVILQPTILVAVWLVCSSDISQGTSPSRGNGDVERHRTSHRDSNPGSAQRRAVNSQRRYPVKNQRPHVFQENKDEDKSNLSQSMLNDEGQRHRTHENQGQRHAGSRNAMQMLKDDSATAVRSRMARFPSTSNSPNILASFAGKNRVLIISAPHASDGYYRLMMSLLKNDVYCELAERHIQQIILFHEEGEEGGTVRRITNEGKIMEQTLDKSLIPKLMSSFKLEKGKFGMVLLKKTLQVEERYPYPVRLEAMYEVVDQSPIRRIEKLRQKGFVQKCKAAGVEGQVHEEGQTEGGNIKNVKPTQPSGTVQTPSRKEETKKSVVMPTRFSRVKPTRKSVGPPTRSPTTRATTVFPSTKATTRILTTASRPPTTIPTTVSPTTQKMWTTKLFTTPELHRHGIQSETTRDPDTQSQHIPVRTDKNRNKQMGKSHATTSRINKVAVHTEAPVISTTRTELTTKENTAQFVDNQTDRKDHGTHDVTPSQKKFTKTKTSKKKGVDKILNNEYEEKIDTGKATTPHVDYTIEESNVPQQKEKEQKKEEKLDKTDKKKKKTEKIDKPPKKEKQAKKDKTEKKDKPEKDRNKKNKKSGKNDNDGYIKPEQKVFVESPKRSLATFLANFEGKRRLLLMTAPKEENKMYSQQRDEYLETVCEMAVRKISIVTIFGPLTNSTMKIDHFQLDNEKPMKVIGEDDLLDVDLITELRKEYGMTYNDFFMVLTDLDMRVKQYYEVPISMKSVFDLVDTFQSRIKEMEKQKRDGITCKREDKTRSLENFLSR